MTRLHISGEPDDVQFYLRAAEAGRSRRGCSSWRRRIDHAYTAAVFRGKTECRWSISIRLRNAQIDPAVNLEELARVAYSMAREVVGLGLQENPGGIWPGGIEFDAQQHAQMARVQ